MHHWLDAAALALAISVLLWAIVFGAIWLDRRDREAER